MGGASHSFRDAVPRQLPQASEPPSEVQRMRMKYPDRVPVLCERAPRSSLPQIAQKKFLIPGTMRCSELKYIIHREVKKIGSIAGDQTIYLFVGNLAPKTSMTIGELYEQCPTQDGVLHVMYRAENTLGGTFALKRPVDI